MKFVINEKNKQLHSKTNFGDEKPQESLKTDKVRNLITIMSKLITNVLSKSFLLFQRSGKWKLYPIYKLQITK